MTAIVPRNQADVIEQVVLQGDLSALDATGRVSYYKQVCESLGLNPLTKPFDYIKLNSKLTLYAKRDATDQLRRIHKVDVTIVSRERQDDVYIVTARATTPDRRTDESIGAVSFTGLKGEGLANALMKAETKAKRRVTLSICGLGWLDETEIGAGPGVQPVQVSEAGEVADAPAVEPPSKPTNGVLDTIDPNTPIGAGLLLKQYKEIGRLWHMALSCNAFANHDAIRKHLQEFKFIANGRDDLTEREANLYIDSLAQMLEA